MFEYLENVDRSIVQLVNSWHSPFFDFIFWNISKTLTWLPLYLLAIYIVWKRYSLKTVVYFTVFALMMVAIVDSTTTYLFKETVQRYRPSHNLLIYEKLHFYQKSNGEYYRGGQYGFFSSHAANNTALALWIWFFLRDFYPKIKWILVSAVLLICLSRIYLTVHYLSDVVCGVLWGSFWAFLAWKVYTELIKKEI